MGGNLFFRSIYTIFSLSEKILPFENTQINLVFCSLIRIFAARNEKIIVMTTVELRSSIVADLDQMSVEMLENVARTVNKAAAKEEVPDIVLSLLGAGTHVADDDLNARKAYNEYLEEKYK